jgi:hypothetical protein
MLIYVFTIAMTIKIDYYLVPLLPIASFFIARPLSVLIEKSMAWPVIIALIAIIGYQSFLAVSPLYGMDKESYSAGIELRKALRPNEPIILGSYNPSILFYSNHKGWRTIDLSFEEFQFLKANGAKYYIPLNSIKDKRLAGYLNANYRLQTTESGCKYYDIAAKK